MSHVVSAQLAEAKHGAGSASSSASAAAAAARPCPYSLFMQDFAEDPFRGSRAPGIGGASTKALARSRRAAGLAAAAAAAAGSGAGAPDLGQEGLRASLDELCNLHEELAAIGRMDPGSDSNIGRLMSIQMRRAETEARLEEHAAAMSDATHARESVTEAVRVAADATRDRAAARRMRIGEPYIPTKRRVVAAPAAAPSGEADEAEDGTDSSAPSPAGAAAAVAAAAAAPATASGGTARATRNPYSREGGNIYVTAPPRRRAPQRDDEGGVPATSRSGSSAAAAVVNAQWERQPTNQYIPAARRRPQLHVPEPPRQPSVGASRSVRAAVAAVAAATTSGSGAASTHPQAAAAPAPAAALFFPLSANVRGGGGGAGQPPPMPSAAFQFGRTSSASAGLPPVFPAAGDSSSAASSHRPSGAGVSVRRARASNRRGSRAEEPERFLGGNPADEGAEAPDGFFSALPPLPPPAPQYRGRGPSAAGGPSSGGGSAPGNAAATAAATAAAAARGVASTAAGTGQSPDPDPASASHGPQASEVAPELAELVELYCGRCQEAHTRLRSAVSEREALSASTLAYLRRGRRGGAGRSGASAMAGGVGAGSSAITASVLSRTTARRGPTTWGGDGGHSGVRGTEKGHGCCAKCTEEVSVICGRTRVGHCLRILDPLERTETMYSSTRPTERNQMVYIFLDALLFCSVITEHLIRFSMF